MTIFFLSLFMWLSFKNIDLGTEHSFAPILQAHCAYAAEATPVSSPFLYTFDTPGILYEAGRASDSSSPYFWLSSGAKFVIADGIGKTQQGALPAYDPWRLMYKSMNWLDSGYGYHPENTLRLITRTSWGDVESSVLFRITATNLTNTPNRDGYSGVFLMARHKDQHNLYYAGIRQDGAAVIKKKINGTYYTLAHTQIFGTQSEYHRWQHANLLPQQEWMSVKMRTENQVDGSVKIELLFDRENNGSFNSILNAVDTGIGGSPFTDPGALGIRTDYMDVEFENFRAENLPQ